MRMNGNKEIGKTHCNVVVCSFCGLPIDV